MPFKNGVKFCGFHTYITKDGQAIRKLKNENKRAAQKKYRRMAYMVVEGKLSYERFSESYNAWKNHASHGNTVKLLRSMDEMIENIIHNGRKDVSKVTSKEQFLSLAKENIKRDGINKLLEWLESTDFYIAPASSKYHGSHSGGLVEHSINTYNHLVKLNSIYQISDSPETITIVSLFHDVCKIGCYKEDTRNVKVNGVWETQPYFAFDEQFKYGAHAAKSVYLIMKYIQLTDEEAVCIQGHMGVYDKPCNDYATSSAFEAFPLALLVHTADMLSTCIDEKKDKTPEVDPLPIQISEILTLCKELIEKGIDKDDVYTVIAEHNKGKKNPNTIKDIEIAKTIYENLKGLT
jgi:hypothetical protein